VVDTTNWLPKVLRKDYTIGLSPMASGPDPDQNLYLNYGCGGELNYNGYCNPAVDELNGLYATPGTSLLRLCSPPSFMKSDN
jgi:ABC-type transport system substrate-binding protein